MRETLMKEILVFVIALVTLIAVIIQIAKLL